MNPEFIRRATVLDFLAPVAFLFLVILMYNSPPHFLLGKYCINVNVIYV